MTYNTCTRTRCVNTCGEVTRCFNTTRTVVALLGYCKTSTDLLDKEKPHHLSVMGFLLFSLLN